MAHIALNQLRVNRYLKPAVESHLKWLALTHQNEAMAILRRKISEPDGGHEILLGALSLATFEHHYGDRNRSLIHIKAFRELYAQLSVETPARPRPSEQQALWFEGINADPEASSMWKSDTSQQRLGWLRDLIEDIDSIWHNHQVLPLKARRPFVQVNTRLQDFLSRPTEGTYMSTCRDIDEAIAQQRCLLILVSLITSVHPHNLRMAQAMSLPEITVVTSAIEAYIDWLEDMLQENELDESKAVVDLLWILLHDPSFENDDSTAVIALCRVDFRELHWRISGVANVAKYLPPSGRKKLHTWLLSFVEGKQYAGTLALNLSSFSYADI